MEIIHQSKKIIIIEVSMKSRYNESGYLMMGVKELYRFELQEFESAAR